MTAERYEILWARCLNELGLDNADIGDPICLDLFGSVLEIYSRFRGLRKVRIIPKQSGVKEYPLTASEFCVEEVLWNHTYPSERFFNAMGRSSASDEFHHPSLRIIDLWKRNMQDYLVDDVAQEAQDTFVKEGEVMKRIIVLESDPITDIILVYRELFDEKNYPVNDEEIIKCLFKSKIIGYILGVPQLRTKGDLTFSIDEMRSMQKEEAAKFYGEVSYSIADRS